MPARTSTFVTIGGLACNTRGIDCYDWSDLLKSPSKRGSNRVIAGETGRLARVRVPDELRAGLLFRLNGAYQQNGQPFEGDWHANMYTLLGAVRAVCDDPDVQTLTFTFGGGSVSADCIVEELGPLTFVTPSVATFVVDVTLPDGPLAFGGS